MTRENAKALLPIILAYAEGKVIQIINPSGEWIDNNEPLFNCDYSIYRIKPAPTYRPFKDAEECWTEMLKHQPFGWVKLKDTESGYYMLKGIASQVGVIGFNEIPFSYKKVFKDYVFADGLPFGIKVEE